MLNRRQFALSLLAGTVLIKGSLVLFRNFVTYPKDVKLAETILAAFPDSIYLAKVGHAILKKGNMKANIPDVVAQLAGNWDNPHLLTTSQIADRLRKQIDEDFAKSKLCIVEEWHLAVTEARICLLAALMEQHVY